MFRHISRSRSQRTRFPRLALALVTGLICAIAAPTSAPAAITSQTITAAATPSTQDQTAFSGVSLSLTEDQTYTGGFQPVLTQIVYHLDNDFAFDTTGLPQCPLSSINGQTRANAIAACPGSVVGSGSGVINGGALTAVVTVFNGQPSGGSPTIYLHLSVANDAVIEVLVGTLGPSARGGDFGTQISIPIPNTGTTLTHLNFTLDNLEPAPGHHYVSARCNDPDHLWNFIADFTYLDSSTGSASASEVCQLPGPTVSTSKDECKNGGWRDFPDFQNQGQCIAFVNHGT